MSFPSSMASSKESHEIIINEIEESNEIIINEPDEKADKIDHKDLSELPPSGTSLHKRRRGEPPAVLTVKSPQTPSDAEGSSPCTAGPTPDDYWSQQGETTPDPISLCESMIQRLKDNNDPLSKQGRDIAVKTKDTIQAVDQLEKLLDLLDQFVTLKEHNAKILKRLRDVEHLKRLHEARKRISLENEKLKSEEKEIQLINEALDADLDLDYGQAVFDSMLSGGRSVKRTGSKWKAHSRFGGSLLRKQRSRSAGGEDSDATPTTPLRRRSEAISSKEVDKSKVSKWTRVKAAFRWEKAQWPAAVMGGAAGAVAAGALVGAVALAGSAPASASSPIPGGPRDSTSLTPGSALSLTPNSSCEELRLDAGSITPVDECRRKSLLRCDENDNSFLHAPLQDDSSTSPSPNKLHKSPWVKMRDIIQTRRESVRKKSVRGSKSSPDVIPLRRRSFSDGGDSDAPPALTLTIPSSEELESEPAQSAPPALRKQRSLELSARPLQQRPPRASKWSKVKRAFLTSASVSVPSSPSRHSAFFTDAETEGLSSGCEASGVRDEIARDYAALQSRLRREFSDRRDKLYAETRPVATEEQLSADFRKKLAEWQRMKGVRQPPPVPMRQDLSDDFLRKWDDWKKMKETNSVPAWEQESKPDEVLVQTSTGLFKFQGISRSFTRKLHEWEKSRGIAPEASTSALLRAARARSTKTPQAPLTRTQSDGSVGPSIAGSGRRHASSLSVNDADNIDLEYDGDGHFIDGGEDMCDGDSTRGALLVEVEAEEVCTAAPLFAVSPRHQPQKPVYTYGHAEARLLCETSSAVTGTAVLQPNGAVLLSGAKEIKLKEKPVSISKGSSRDQSKAVKKLNSKSLLNRQKSIEEDAEFIRKTIEEIERGSSCRFKTEDIKYVDADEYERLIEKDSKENISDNYPSTSQSNDQKGPRANFNQRDSSRNHEIMADQSNEKDDTKLRDGDKLNYSNKKKSKSRARLEREQSKPSESDTEVDIDTVTVEIPRRRKRTRRPSERPKTPPTSLHSDSESEAPEPREESPEVIVKTTRKIFSPVVRSGESVPRAVIPLDVDDLADVKPSVDQKSQKKNHAQKNKIDGSKVQRKREELNARSKSSGDLQETEDQRKRNRPPLPLSPSSQRKPQAKETAPSIRIMIQRYNMKINEEGHTSGASSGASSPAWRSPAAERRRPPDMPVGVNIRNNPFLEREVQKSASACQLSRREQSSTEKSLSANPSSDPEVVLKSHSTNALHPENAESAAVANKKIEVSLEAKNYETASTDTIVPDLTRNLPVFATISSDFSGCDRQSVPNVLRQISLDMAVPVTLRTVGEKIYDRSVSLGESTVCSVDSEAAARAAERAARIRAARERFLSSPGPMRREGTSSANDLRPGDRSSRISCESDITEARSMRSSNEEAALGRSASTGMVNVDREAWERVAEGGKGRQQGRPGSRSRFSLARLAAKLRRKDEGAVSRLCRQSLLVQLRNKQ